MSNYEEKIAEFEHARNTAMDKYFSARPQLLRTIKEEKLFEAGFRMAWNFLKEQLTI